MHINDLRKHFLCLIHHAEEKMKPSTALGIILDLVSNSQLLGSIVTQICVDETLTINLRGFFSLAAACGECINCFMEKFHS